MVTPSAMAYLGLVALLAIERMIELTISRRNAAWAFRQGGVETGQGHFGVMKALHTGFLVACCVEVVLLERPFIPSLGYPMLAVALTAQALRYWAISSLGPYWNVRVIVVPGAVVKTGGPYRYLRHPNYLAVILEGIAIPMIHSAWITAAVFTLLNAALLSVRIRCEERALTEHCSYQQQLGRRRRLVPGGINKERS